MTDKEKIEIAREYFIRADQGRADLMDILHKEAEIYYPKFGFGFGRESLFDMVKGFEGRLEFIQHDYDQLHFMPSGDYVIVEGTSKGKLAGQTWQGGNTPGGRSCNVFKFRDERIISVHMYLDPDYTGEDEARFRRGKDRSW